MELTKEQIQRVDKYLDVKGVKFIDFRIEIFDHIVSQIENEIIKGRSFDSAFTYTTLRWNSQLRDSFSWFFGVAFTAPKTVINKAKKIHKPVHIILMLFMAVILSGVSIPEFGLKELNINIGYIFKTIVGFLTIIGIFISFKFNLDKKKTVYSFLAKTQIPVFLLPLILLGSSFNDYVSISAFVLFILCIVYLMIILKKHQQEKEKYKLLVKN